MRVALIDNFEVSVAGVRSLLAPYSGRVALLDLGSAMNKPSSVDVILYEPVRQTPSSQAMLRDLVRASQKSAIVYSWRDKEGQVTGSRPPTWSVRSRACTTAATAVRPAASPATRGR